MNPMIRKELRQRMRERRGWILPSLYLLTLSAIISFAYYEASSEASATVQGWQIGTALFLTLTYSQLALLLLMAPIFSAGDDHRKGAEHSAGSADFAARSGADLAGKIRRVADVHSSAAGDRDSGAQRGFCLRRRGPVGSGHRGVHDGGNSGNG
jgi:hypothetical protein